MGWLLASLSFAIIRAINLCLRGSCIRWRSALDMVDMVDGIGLSYIVEYLFINISYLINFCGIINSIIYLCVHFISFIHVC